MVVPPRVSPRRASRRYTVTRRWYVHHSTARITSAAASRYTHHARRTPTVPARGAVARRIFAAVGTFRARSTFGARLRRPGESVEDFGLGHGLDGGLALGDRVLCLALGGGRDDRLRLDLFALATFALVAKSRHEVGELLERHAGDRQHVGRRFEPGTAVLLAQDVGQPFQHVDADGAVAGRMIAREDVVAARQVGNVGDGHQPRRRAGQEFRQVVGQRPEQKPQPGRRRFQQQRQEDRVLAEPHAMLAKRAARLLVQRLNLVGDAVARQDAQSFGQAEGKAAGQALKRFVTAHRQKRLERGGDLAVDEVLKPATDLVGHVEARLFVDEGFDLGLQRLGTLDQLADRMGAPHQPALVGEVQFGIGGVVEPIGTQMKLGLQGLVGGLSQGAPLVSGRRSVLLEAEALQTADELAFDCHFTLVVHLSHKALLLLEPAKQHGCPPVHKSLRQPGVKRV